MKKYEVSEEILNKIMGYLGTCPFAQVNDMIMALQAELRPQLLQQPPDPVVEDKE